MRIHEIPRRVIFADESFEIENGLATPNGKLRRQAIAKKYSTEIQEALDQLDLSKFDPLSKFSVTKTPQKSIKALINEVLERDPSADINEGDDFITLGGDSLAAAKVIPIRAY